MIRAAILHKAHHLLVDRIRSLRGDMIAGELRSSRNAVPIAGLGPARRNGAEFICNTKRDDRFAWSVFVARIRNWTCCSKSRNGAAGPGADLRRKTARMAKSSCIAYQECSHCP